MEASAVANRSRRPVGRVPSRLLAAAGAAVLASGLLLALPAGPAHALGTDVQCEGTFEIAFDPPLTDVSQGSVTNRDHASYATCETGLPGTSATVHREPGETCVDVLTALASYNEVITWSDQTTSTVRWSSVEGTLSGATATGTVIAGRYLGDTAAKVVDALTLSGDNPELCPIGAGTLSGVSGPATLTPASL